MYINFSSERMSVIVPTKTVVEFPKQDKKQLKEGKSCFIHLLVVGDMSTKILIPIPGSPILWYRVLVLRIENFNTKQHVMLSYQKSLWTHGLTCNSNFCCINDFILIILRLASTIIQYSVSVSKLIDTLLKVLGIVSNQNFQVSPTTIIYLIHKNFYNHVLQWSQLGDTHQCNCRQILPARPSPQ